MKRLFKRPALTRQRKSQLKQDIQSFVSQGGKDSHDIMGFLADKGVIGLDAFDLLVEARNDKLIYRRSIRHKYQSNEPSK